MGCLMYLFNVLMTACVLKPVRTMKTFTKRELKTDTKQGIVPYRSTAAKALDGWLPFGNLSHANQMVDQPGIRTLLMSRMTLRFTSIVHLIELVNSWMPHSEPEWVHFFFVLSYLKFGIIHVKPKHSVRATGLVFDEGLLHCNIPFATKLIDQFVKVTMWPSDSCAFLQCKTCSNVHPVTSVSQGHRTNQHHSSLTLQHTVIGY